MLWKAPKLGFLPWKTCLFSLKYIYGKMLSITSFNIFAFMLCLLNWCSVRHGFTAEQFCFFIFDFSWLFPPYFFCFARFCVTRTFTDLRLNLLPMTITLKPCLCTKGDPTAKAWHSYLPNWPYVLSCSSVTFRMCIVTKSFFNFFPSVEDTVEVLGKLAGYIINYTSSNSFLACLSLSYFRIRYTRNLTDS